MSADKRYKELCKEYGHLTYTKKCIEERMHKLELLMSQAAEDSKQEAVLEQLKQKVQNERSE